MKGNQGGLTLAEVVLALGLLATISLSLVALFSKLIASSTKTGDLSAGRILAEKVLDRAVRNGPSSNWGLGGSLGGTRDITTRDEASHTTFIYSVTPSLLKEQVWAPGAWRTTRLYHVEVEVYWWVDDPTQSRVDLGRLSTNLSQVVEVIE